MTVPDPLILILRVSKIKSYSYKRIPINEKGPHYKGAGLLPKYCYGNKFNIDAAYCPLTFPAGRPPMKPAYSKEDLR